MTRLCEACGGRGGIRGPFGWIRCNVCQRRPTNRQALDAAVQRYITCVTEHPDSATNIRLAKQAAIGAGATEAQLHEAVTVVQQLRLLA